MRRPLPNERPRADRWLVSYADLVTLLLACFATAFAAASEPRAQPASQTVEQSPLPAIVPPLPAVPSLREIVAPALAAGDVPVELVQDERGLVISLPESAAFPSGSADLTAEAKAFLSRLADQLRDTACDLRVEGHTDDRPIRGGRYATNWELSTARASAVVLYLIADASFAPSRLSAAGYGEFHPRFVNDSAESRAASEGGEANNQKVPERPTRAREKRAASRDNRRCARARPCFGMVSDGHLRAPRAAVSSAQRVRRRANARTPRQFRSIVGAMSARLGAGAKGRCA